MDRTKKQKARIRRSVIFFSIAIAIFMTAVIGLIMYRANIVEQSVNSTSFVINDLDLLDKDLNTVLSTINRDHNPVSDDQIIALDNRLTSITGDYSKLKVIFTRYGYSSDKLIDLEERLDRDQRILATLRNINELLKEKNKGVEEFTSFKACYEKINFKASAATVYKALNLCIPYLEALKTTSKALDFYNYGFSCTGDLPITFADKYLETYEALRDYYKAVKDKDHKDAYKSDTLYKANLKQIQKLTSWESCPVEWSISMINTMIEE